MSDVASSLNININVDKDNAINAFQSIETGVQSCTENSTEALKKMSESEQEAEKGAEGFGSKIAEWGAQAAEWLVIEKGAELLGEFKDKLLEMPAAFVEALAQGGEFNAQMSAFNSVAAAAGQSGDAFVAGVQKMSGGAIGVAEAMKLAGGAIQHNMGSETLDVTIEYAKHWAELTGQSVNSVADTMVTAMERGRLGVFNTMGIIVEKGDTVADVFQKMQDKMSAFGDEAPNVGESVKSISNSIEEFTLKSEAAAQSAPTLSGAFKDLATDAFDFVKGLDYTVITGFFETGAQSAKAFIAEFLPDIKSIGAAVASEFSGMTGSSKGFFSGLSDAFFGVVESIESGANASIDVLQTITSGVGTVTSLITGLGADIGELVGSIPGVVKTGLGKILLDIENWGSDMAKDHPMIAKLIGFDQGAVDEARQYGAQLIAEGTKDLEDVSKAADSTKTTVGAVFNDAVDEMESWKFSVSDLEEKHLALNNTISNINYTPVVEKATTAAAQIGDAMKKALSPSDLGYDPLGVMADDLDDLKQKIAGIDFSKLGHENNLKAFESDAKDATRALDEMVRSEDEAFKAEQKSNLIDFEASVKGLQNAKDLIEQFKAQETDAANQHTDAEKKMKEATTDRINSAKEKFQEEQKAADEYYKREQEDAATAFKRETDDKESAAKQQEQQQLESLKRVQEMQLQAFEATHKKDANYDVELTAFRNFQATQTDTVKQQIAEQDTLRKRSEEDAATAFKRNQADAREQMHQTANTAGEIGDALGNVSGKFASNIRDLPATLSQSFNSIKSIAEDLDKTLAQDPMESASDRASKLKDILDKETSAQDRLITALEKLSDSNKDAKLKMSFEWLNKATDAVVLAIMDGIKVKVDHEDASTQGI